MAFINEYISEEDIKKYDVKYAWEKISGPGEPSKYTWTVDKEKNIYFIPMVSGKEEFSNQKLCALWWSGALLRVSLANVGGQLDYDNSKGSVVWDLLRIWKPTDFILQDDEIIPILKEALVVYGFSGISIPIIDYRVDFTF